ncbi:MAG: glycerophosphodiester phosphodiesterase family protein [Pseudomonadota bacterium]
MAAVLAACAPGSGDDAGTVETGEETARVETLEAAQTPEAAPGDRAPGRAVLAGWFDCLRENDAITIAAHRGGPAPGYPENAIETLQHNFDQGIEVFEVDVAESQDGVLFLLHDRSLGRTTTGRGQLVERDWDEISSLRLKDTGGAVTDFNPPRLTDALLWARQSGAILELDRKSSTSFRNIISAVRAAEAEDHVVLISYNEDQAAEISRLAPELVLTASARGKRDLVALEQMGVNLDNLVAWTGTREPDAAAWTRLNREGVEPGFGTLGRPGQRLDDTYAADGDLSEFVDLADAGLRLISTDIPLEVADALDGDDRGNANCPR